ncbi:hypothetical protein BC940DRAFT_295258 [Gongronella butleri]|nr:hypothetical protein BC940DRAFT_295258 [Gongronella butleri]
MAGPSTHHKTAHIVLSEDEDEDDPKYTVSDGEDEDPASMPSGKALELLQTEKVCFAGYLLKKGEKRRTWKKRWFVLRTTKLAMYKDKKEYKLLRIIDLHDIHSVVQVTSKNKYRNVFAIITPKRMYYVQADDQRSMDGWFEAIEHAKQDLRLYDADDDESSVNRDHEFAKDVVSSYKSNASNSSNPLAQQQHHQLPSTSLSSSSSSAQQRRRSSITIDTARRASLDQHRQISPITTSPVAAPPSATANAASAAATPLTQQADSAAVPPATTKTTPAKTQPTNPRIEIPPTRIDTSITSSSSASPPAPRHPQQQVTFASSSLSEYTTGQIYPVSPTLEHAQHIADGIASSEDDEEYSATNSIIDLKKEEDRNRVLVEGYLLKLGRNKGWQKRWFVLRTDTLAYYENDKEYSPHRIIPLQHIIDSLEIDAMSKNKQYCFKIIIPKRNYVLCASTENDMESWLNALSIAIRRAKKDAKNPAAAAGTAADHAAATSPTSPLASSSSAAAATSDKVGKSHHHAPHHQALRLERIPEIQKLPSAVRRLSIESFENSSHISGVSGAGGVGGAGGALGRR